MLGAEKRGKLEVEKNPTPSTFKYWQLNFESRSSVSDDPSDGMLWVRETEAAQNTDDLRTSLSIKRKHYPKFETLDAKIAEALKKILDEHELQEKGLLGRAEMPKDTTGFYKDD